jgi:hypothetical protein
MRIAIVVLVAALAGACATPSESKGAQTAPAVATSAKAAPAKAASTKSATAKEDRVCKRTMVTGSVMPQSVCHSKEEWAAIEQRDREGSEDLTREMRSATTSRP